MNSALNITTTTEFDHVRILRIDDIRPSSENAKLYRPIDPEDPDVQALAASMREHGVQEALVVSTDGWIISGHRRHVAAKLIGLDAVPCRVHPIRRDTDADGFLVLLREFNRQRVKSFDEKVREEVVTGDPEEAYQALLDHRRERSRVSAETMVLGDGRRRARITSAKHPLLAAVREVLSDRKDFWPLSDRQIHYALLNNPPLIHASKPGATYRNDRRSYAALVDLLTRARLNGAIPFEVIADPTRPVVLWQVHADTVSFVRSELDGLLKGYWRDLQRTQPNHIELVVEKNTAEAIVRPVAADYTLPLTSGRGYCSLPPRHDMAIRFNRSGKKSLVLLLLSDFGPDGEEIAAGFARSMRDDFGIGTIVPVRVALTAEQVARFDLPPRMTAKDTSSRHDSFVGKHGHYVYELEALRPEDLQAVLREAIESVIDRAVLDQELRAEKQDAAQLASLRRRVQKALAGQLPLKADHE